MPTLSLVAVLFLPQAFSLDAPPPGVEIDVAFDAFLCLTGLAFLVSMRCYIAERQTRSRLFLANTS